MKSLLIDLFLKSDGFNLNSIIVNSRDSYINHEAIAMLNQLLEKWEDSEEAWDHLMKRYLFACGHAIWKLLLQEESRKGIEVAERFMIGLASYEEFELAEFKSEGAAFNLDYNCAPEDIKGWINDFKRIPREELSQMIHPVEAIKKYKPQKLLMYAAYFAHFTMRYPNYVSVSTITTGESIPPEYWIFLSPSVLREIILMD
jgi:hypothetical protein